MSNAGGTRRNEQVKKLQTFADTNKYAVNLAGGQLYVVYSYGPHYPLLVHDREERRWYVNTDRFSVTTSKHKTQCIPHGCTLEPATTGFLIRLIQVRQSDHPLPYHLPRSMALVPSESARP